MISGTLQVTGQIAPSSITDAYPTHEDKYGKGGYMIVADITERNAIPTQRRKAYMQVRTANDGALYELALDLTTWITPSPSLGGDMTKAVYDPNDDGQVLDSEHADLADDSLHATQADDSLHADNADNALDSLHATDADTLATQLPAFYLLRSNHTGTQAESTIVGLVGDLSARELLANKGVANGYCDLDSGGKVPLSRLTISGLTWKGVWDVGTNIPALADGTGSLGWWYKVSVAGTRNLGSGNITFAIGDWVIHNGTIWEKNGTVDIITSVNGQIGAVTLTTATISDSSDKRYVTDAFLAAMAGTNGTPSGANKYVTDSDPRNSDSRAPNGTAGGDLIGTYPNPTIGLLKVTDAKVATANKDGLAAVPSMRTLGTGAQQAASGTDTRLTDKRRPTVPSEALGDLLWFDGSGWARVPKGTSGQLLQCNVNTIPTWVAPPSGGGGTGSGFDITIVNTSTYTVLPTDTCIILMVPCVVQLTAASTWPNETPLIFIDGTSDAYANPHTINRAGSDTFAKGGTTVWYITVDDGSLEIVSNEISKWFITQESQS